MNLKFDYYYGYEAEQFSFYRIPKMLFKDKRFSHISPEAKILFGILLDRMSLSVKNNWIDEENHVYIYFKVSDIVDEMCVGKGKAVKLLAELDDNSGCGLIKKNRQGLGKPSRIYIMNFASIKEDNVENLSNKASQTLENRTLIILSIIIINIIILSLILSIL